MARHSERKKRPEGIFPRIWIFVDTVLNWFVPRFSNKVHTGGKKTRIPKPIKTLKDGLITGYVRKKRHHDKNNNNSVSDEGRLGFLQKITSWMKTDAISDVTFLFNISFAKLKTFLTKHGDGGGTYSVRPRNDVGQENCSRRGGKSKRAHVQNGKTKCMQKSPRRQTSVGCGDVAKFTGCSMKRLNILTDCGDSKSDWQARIVTKKLPQIGLSSSVGAFRHKEVTHVCSIASSSLPTILENTKSTKDFSERKQVARETLSSTKAIGDMAKTCVLKDLEEKIKSEVCYKKNTGTLEHGITPFNTPLEFPMQRHFSKAITAISPLSNPQNEKISETAPPCKKASVNPLDNIKLRTLEPWEIEPVMKKGRNWILGRGSFGEVTMVKCFSETGYTQLAAMKICRKVKEDKIREEAKILAYLSMTGYVPFLFGVMEIHSKLAIIQQYISESISLFSLVNGQTFRLVCMSWIRIAHQLADGLAHIHFLQATLNDIKEDNVLINLSDVQNPTLKYIDMGTATVCRSVTFPDDPASMAQYFHLAPEVRHNKPTSTMSDIFSLGRMYRNIGKVSDIVTITDMSVACMANQPTERPSASTLEFALRNLIR